MKKFGLHQRIPSSFVSIFFKRWDVEKITKGPFYCFWLYDTVQKPHFKVFSNIFLSIQGTPSFFFILKQTRVSESPKGPSFTILKASHFLSRRYSADFGRSWLVMSSCKFCGIRVNIQLFALVEMFQGRNEQNWCERPTKNNKCLKEIASRMIFTDDFV